MVSGAGAVCADPPLAQDVVTNVGSPFSLSRWLDDHAATLATGARLPLFPGVPTDILVDVAGGPLHEAFAASPHDTWLHQLRGDALCYRMHPSPPSPPSGAAAASTSSDDEAATDAAGTVEQWLPEGSCAVVPAGVPYAIRRDPGSIGLVATRRHSATAPSA